MKKTKNFIAVLLVAMGTSSVAFAGGDTLKSSSNVRVISFNKNDSYKLIYKSEGKQNVIVNVLDEKGVSVHKGSVRVADGFAQNFDLSNVPTGYYTFEVVSKGEKVAQTVYHVSEVDKLTQHVALSSNADTKKMVLRSSASVDAPLSVAIYGGEDELLFTEDVKSVDFLTRVYDLSQIKGAGVRFTVSYNNTVVKDQKFDF
jgi:hypothetical protein